MKLLIQPDDGVLPLVSAIQKAAQSIDQVIFRFDLPEVEKALHAAVLRGVTTRSLIAHTNQSGEKKLRQLELRLLEHGLTVARTGDDLVRYHGKLLIIDRRTLYLLGFNFTKADTDHSRSFGIVTRKRSVVHAALTLFEADSSRQQYTDDSGELIVSPVNARRRLAAFIGGARRELFIYDPKLSDAAMIRALVERVDAGVDVRVIGAVGKRGASLQAQKLRGMRLHVRAMVRDGRAAFVGSQSLRKLELDARREVGIIVRDLKVVKRLRETFVADWEKSPLAQAASEVAGADDEPAAASA